MLTAIRSLRHRREVAGGDGGMTAIEIMVASAIMVTVIALIMGVMVSLTNADQRAQALVSNEQRVRFMLNDMARDLRGATPLTVYTTKSDYETSIQFTMGPVGGKQNIRWIYDTNPASPTYQTIRRQVMSSALPTASVVSSVTQMERARNDVRGLKFLAYFNSDGQDMFVDAPFTTASDVANCAVRMRLTVTADSEPGPEPFTETLDVHLRARLPGGLGC